ncbi:MAG: hypothetical protein AAF432_00445 [Planctomycetota bacterium]
MFMMAREFGYTPQQIAGMTPRQALMLLESHCGTGEMSLDEAIANGLAPTVQDPDWREKMAARRAGGA